MYLFKRLAGAALLIALCLSTRHLEAVSYVTDTGGYAYDESRAATNLAPAIALGTVAVVGVIALAVQNSHDSSSSSSSHYGSSGGTYSGSYGDYYYYYYYPYSSSSSSGHF